ncbi:MAG: hypothetical protein MJ211_05145 [Bacteroidales bacterium]|nr:hypothetical protein [Bacteroidales bacterium]
MKNNKVYVLLLSTTLAYILILFVLNLAKPISKDKDVAYIINSGLKLLENDSLSFNAEENNKENVLLAKEQFEKAYNLYPNEPYMKYCAGLLNFCTGNNDKAKEILGDNYISPECSFIQSEICLKKNDTLTLTKILSTTIENKPDFIESEYFQNLIKNDSIICKNAVSMAKNNLLNKLSNNNEAQTMAKLGKIYLSECNFDEAQLYFNKTIELLPNLNRPYFYLAFINLANGDTINFERNINIAEYLDSSDPLIPAIKRYKQGKQQLNNSSIIFKLPFRFEFTYGIKFRKNAIIIKEINYIVKPKFEYFIKYFN